MSAIETTARAVADRPASDKMLARKQGKVGTMIFNNPERHNAVSLEMWDSVRSILDDFAADPEVTVVVITGAGDKAFVSGADISKFGDERANKEAVAHYNTLVERAYIRLAEFPKPTIAMIRGYCIGGGLGLAVACDLRICSDNSTFALPAAKLSLGYGYTGLKRFVDLVGPGFTKEIFYTARQFTAAEAREMGLVNRVVPAAELEAYVQSYASTIAGNAPLTLKAVKIITNEILTEESKRDLARCTAAVQDCFDSEDYIEGRDAFMQKRKPVFKGK